MQVDELLHHGHIYTVDASFHKVEAMAVSQGKIVALGSSDELLRQFTAKRSIHLEGRAVYPGFIDAHGHLSRYGRARFEVDLRGCLSFDEVIARVRAYARKHPEGWIIGRGWDQNTWPGHALPTKAPLDILFPDRPVALERVDIHALVCNSVALQLAGIQPGLEIAGGHIGLENNELTGLLVDHAQSPVWAQVPPPDEAMLRQHLIRAAEDCQAFGLTSVGDALLDHDTAQRIAALQSQGDFPLRVFGMLVTDDAHLDRYLPQGPQRDPWLHIGAFKLFADGTLGSRGAWMTHPYHDAPDTVGLALLPPEITRWQAQRIYEAGFQLCVHAIGDAANHWVIELMKGILPKGNDRRWRIEHMQVLAPEDREALTHYNIVPSLQPTHATSDMGWVGKRLGLQRLQWAYPQQDLLRRTGRVALGSDFPVESPNPLLGFYAAITRQDIHGQPQGGFMPEECLTREQALRGMTIWAAWAQHEEMYKGSLEVGKWADWVMTDQDIMRVDASLIPMTQVLAISVGGNISCPHPTQFAL